MALSLLMTIYKVAARRGSDLTEGQTVGEGEGGLVAGGAVSAPPHCVPSDGRAPENAHLRGVWTGRKQTIREESCKPQSPRVCSSRGAWLQAAGRDEKGQGGLGEARASGPHSL